MKSAGKARSNGLYRHIRTSKEIIRNLLNDFNNKKVTSPAVFHPSVSQSFSRMSSRIRTESSTHPRQLLSIVPVVIPFNSLHTVL